MQYDYDEPEYVARCSGWVVNFWIHLCTGIAMVLAILSLMSLSSLSPKNYVAQSGSINTASTGGFFISPTIQEMERRLVDVGHPDLPHAWTHECRTDVDEGAEVGYARLYATAAVR